MIFRPWYTMLYRAVRFSIMSYVCPSAFLFREQAIATHDNSTNATIRRKYLLLFNATILSRCAVKLNIFAGNTHAKVPIYFNSTHGKGHHWLNKKANLQKRSIHAISWWFSKKKLLKKKQHLPVSYGIGLRVRSHAFPC